MNRTTYTLFLCLFLFLTGCSSTGPAFQKPLGVSAKKAQLYIYRPDDPANIGRLAKIFINDKEFYFLENAGFQAYSLKPGTYRVAYTDGHSTRKRSVLVKLLAGKKTYLRLSHYYNSAYVREGSPKSGSGFNLNVVNKKTGAREIRYTYQSMK